MEFKIDVVITAVLSFVGALLVALLGQKTQIQKLIREAVESETKRLHDEIAFWRSKYADALNEINKLRVEVSELKAEISALRDRLRNYETLH